MLVLSLSLLACTREVVKETPLCDAPAAWYLDADGDGWGSDAPDQAPLEACFAPAGYAARMGDCDDADPAVHPGQPEPDCGAQVDANCDGSVGPVDADGDGVDACTDCDDADAGAGTPATWSLDADGDGFGGTRLATTACEAPEGYVTGAEDCDDLDAAVNPDALEVCDGLDNDCSGDIDEGVEGGSAWYRDADGDGHGDPDDVLEACGAPGGYVPRGDDCDDRDAGVLPGAAETCDGIDQDCDGSVDEDAEGALPWYPDTDGDGVGATGAESWSCVAIEGHVATDGDCDDTDAGVYPGATETCDGVDQDCDGDTDDDATDAVTWYADLDGDGTAGGRWTTTQCDAPAGYLAAAGDCDDLDDTRYPGAPETCDGEDDDCDGLTDEDAPDAGVWFADRDGDGAGDPADTLTACDSPLGYVATEGDCDDADPTVAPDALETCDGLDNDCDGDVDSDAIDRATWYADADGDGVGDGSTGARACGGAAGRVAVDGDCDDTDARVYPGASETCDGVDQDCDGDTDEDATDAVTWYADLDGDGTAGTRWTVTQCDAPAGYLAAADDCDDLDDTRYPGAPETCDGEDDDCDGLTDEDSPDAGVWFADRDGDGAGDPADTLTACDSPLGYVATEGDCDDADPTVAPDALETCDGLDNDCDGDVDSDAIDRATWYADADGDGTGDASVRTRSCDVPAGHVGTAGDCDDTSVDRRPGSAELCDGLDNDCDGAVDDSAIDRSTWYRDADGDGAGVSSTTTRACDSPAGYAAIAGDCDDGDASIAPAAEETCDGVDQDCDGDTDEGAVDAVIYYYDVDGDGYGNARFPLAACDAPDGYVANSDDCDDTDAYAYPGATERCDDADNDCDGSVDEGLYVVQYADTDGDGFGDPAMPEYACLGTYGLVSDATDCDDDDADINTDATEVCDGLDNDCDGGTDESLLVRRYADLDGDGYGDPAVALDVCPDEPDTSDDDTDCDDADAGVRPGAAETCDGVDEDCDGATDEGLLGVLSTCPAETCAELLASVPGTANGTYYLDGSGTTRAVLCDMTGGGWTRVLADTMDSPDSGWSSRTTTSCGGVTMLGGYNVFGAGASVSNSVSTPYTHTQVKVTLDYWFVDSWDGESGTLDVGGARVWSRARSFTSGTNRCGASSSDWREETEAVSATVSHTGSSITLTASSTLNQSADDESWGLDNVVVWVR